MAQAEAQEHPAATPADFAQRNAPHSDAGGGGIEAVLGDAAQSVKNKARDIAEEQKAAGAERLGAFSKAVHGAADELGKELPGAAGYIHSAAEQMENASSRLRQSSVNELVGRFERFARNQPAAAFAGAITVGFALSRFLKSSSQ